ncbi:MAG: 30S ribosomal protein S16 [Alphaproteobacteria bacterium]|jgi:small subunit ribosomal protein S16|nr:30S ribosomal protein S16 [Alphaproteobacteria bacterium]
MAVKLRLARGGSKKRPFYSIVAADNRAPRDGRFIEKIGTYNPMLSKEDENRVVINSERAKYWLSVGALPTDRVALFLGKAGIAEMPAQKNNPNKAKPKAKAQMRAEEKAAAEAEAKAAAEEAAREAAEAKAAAESEIQEAAAEEVAKEEAEA